jgi:photosystem II stability/assembly factor-like uncharacterized protein
LLLLAAVPVFAASLMMWRVDTTAGAQATSQWTPFAPVPFLVSGSLPTNPNFNTYNSGRISSIAVDPRDSNRWLAGVGNGGVWETRDAGDTWAPITDDAPTLATGSIAFAPSNPDIIYVGTGEGHGGGFSNVGVGILKSTNGGRTWALLGQSSLARMSIKRLRVDPNNPDIIVVASTRGGHGRDAGDVTTTPSGPRGVQRSTDGGATWTRTLAGESTALEVDPRSFARQYAAIMVGSDRNGIYRSMNGGVTWTRLDGPWWSNPADISVSNGRIELAMAPSNPDVVYASIAEAITSPRRNDLLGLYRTENAWADNPTWIQVPLDAIGRGAYCGATAAEAGKCEYSHVISVDPLDANKLFAGGQRTIWRCTNCGASPTWTNITSDSRIVAVHVDYHAMAWAANRLLVGSDGGVFSTANFGATWASHNRTLLTHMFYMGALHPTDPAFVVTGTRDFGLVTHRAGLGWRTTPVVSGSIEAEGEVAMSSSRPATDWASTSARLQISRTTDGGRTAIEADTGLDRTGASFVAPLRKCPAKDDVFLAGTYRLWRSDDFFSAPRPSWTAQTASRAFPAPGFGSTTDPGVIISIAFSPTDTNCATYAYGTRGGEVRLTRDGGSTWTDLDPARSLPARAITSLAIDPSNPNRMFAAVSNYDVATPAKPGHIFRTDNALSASPRWTRAGPPDQPFADVPFNVIVIDPQDSQIVYAGSDNGLWESRNGGDTWVKVGLGSGLPPASVYDIQINTTTNKTILFTHGRGAFELVR